jgi:AcrR family transcriptional regulator
MGLGPGLENSIKRSTDHGRRQADLIIEATFRVLSKEGYGGASLQRIADEAGVQKRMVSYYFGSRKALLRNLVARVGDRLMEQLSSVSEAGTSPAEAVEALFDHLWTQVKEDPQPYAVYFGLVAEAVTDGDLRLSVNAIGDRYRDLIRHRIRSSAAPDSTSLSEPSLVIAISAAVQGLTLELLMRGETEELRQAVVDFKRWLRSALTAAPELEADRELDCDPVEPLG